MKARESRKKQLNETRPKREKHKETSKSTETEKESKQKRKSSLTNSKKTNSWRNRNFFPKTIYKVSMSLSFTYILTRKCVCIYAYTYIISPWETGGHPEA